MAAKRPWVRRIVGKQSEAKLQHEHGESSSDGEEEAADLTEVYAAVAEARLDAANDSVDVGLTDFVVEPRGGAFT